MSDFKKIQMTTPLVEMDGDEMTRILWRFHPIVIKTEYYTGTKFWWIFLLCGIICIALSLLVEQVIISSVTGVLGASFLWSIGELFEQKKRVEKGWFPKRPKR